MSAIQSTNVPEDLREAVQKLPVVPTDKFLLQVEEEVTKREKQAGDEAYVIAAKKVRAQQLAPQQLVKTMLELVTIDKPKRGRPAKVAASGTATKTEQPEKAAQTSDSTESEEPGVSGGDEA